MKKLFIFLSLLLLASCKKKDADPTPATTGNSASYVNGYVLLYKNYDFTLSGNDTLYSKSYSANANLYNVPVNILNDIGNDVYSGTLYANADTLYYAQGSGYITYPTVPMPPISWGFTNSSVFGTNTVVINDTCANLSKANIFAIHKNLSLSQNFVFDMTTISVPFEQCHINYYNLNTGQSGIKIANYGANSISFPASDFAQSAPDSVMINVLLTTDNYKIVNGKSILFRNIGTYTKTIHITP